MIRAGELVTALDDAERALRAARNVLVETPDRPELAIAASAALAQWRLRNTHLPASLFADTEWTTLLLLAEAEACGRTIRQIQIFTATGVPHTTGFRVIDRLVEAKLVERGPGVRGPKSRTLRLSREGLRRMNLALGASDAS